MSLSKSLSSTAIVLIIVGLLFGAGLGWYLKPIPKIEEEPESPLPGVVDGETIVITASGGAIQEAFEEDINPGFVKYIKDTYGLTVHVEVFPLAGMMEAVSKLEAARSAGEDPPFDVLESPQSYLRVLHNLDLVADLNYDNLPNSKLIVPAAYPWLMPGYAPAILLQSFQLAYNTEKAAEVGVEVDSWLDLGDPAFEGKVGFPLPTGSHFFQVLQHIERGLGGYDEDPDLPLAFKWFEEVLLPLEPIFWGGSAHMQALFESEEIWISPGFGGRTYTLMARGVPLDIIGPKEGSFYAYCSTEMVKGTKHRRLAEEFINYQLGEQAQIWYAEHTHYGFTVEIDPLPSSLKGLVHTPEQLMAETTPQNDLWYAENKDRLIDKAEQLIASAG